MNEEAHTLVERARALVPLLEQHAAEAERQRKPADAVIDALCEARIFELMVPRCYGGLELDMDAFLEVGLALSEGDASMAWVATFYIEHCWIFCQFPESFQRKLFAERPYVLAPGMIAPNGRAERVEGGYRLSGRWSWSTGVMHATWVMAGAISEVDGQLDAKFFALPMEDVRVEDTWHTDGMCGTGSNDVVIENAFVPDERAVSMIEMVEGRAPGARLHEGPLYRTPMLAVLSPAAAMPAVGQARAAVRRFREQIQKADENPTLVRRYDKPAIQMRLGRAELEVRAAEALLRETIADIMAKRQLAGVEDRSRWSASFAFVVHKCKAVVQEIAEASGASSHFLSHPLQRSLRDVNMLSNHVVFDLDGYLENYGRVLLGLDPSARLL